MSHHHKHESSSDSSSSYTSVTSATSSDSCKCKSSGGSSTDFCKCKISNVSTTDHCKCKKSADGSPPDHCKCKKSMDIATSTADEIRRLCGDCDREPNVFCVSRDDYRRPSRRFDPGATFFTSVITPLTGLTPGFSGCMGSVEFRMRRKNKTVILQWEPFTGTLSSSGVAFLTVAQSICNTPPYIISIPIYIVYKGIGRTTHITIDPFAKSGNIKFYLNKDGSSSNTTVGDSISVPGGAVSWIVD